MPDVEAAIATRCIDHWIAGRLIAGSSDRTRAIWDPARGIQRAAVRLAGTADVGAAVRAALDAFPEWSDSSVSRRARVMFAFRELIDSHSDELARVISLEHGKTLDDARGEVVRGLEVVDYACSVPQLLQGAHSDQVSTGVDAYSFRQPIGVCAGITPFNFPIMVPMWMHPIAIAVGNTFVLKPSERDPSVSNMVAELYAEAGLPDGVFNVVHGDQEAVNALLDHGGVAAVSFVGSTPVAQHVFERATASRKRVQALGGAKNHAVVMPDADLDSAADQLVAAAFGSAGQRCMAISVAIAVGDVGDQLVSLLEVKGRRIKVGPGLDEGSEMGPLVTPESRDRVASYVTAGSEAGAELILDGRELDVPTDGFFVGPTVFDHVAPDMSIYRDEIFGPVLSVVRAADLDDAIALINANPFANGAAIFTQSGHSARRFQREAGVGMVGVNVPIPVPMAWYSFGGWRDSLFGDHHIHGPEGVRFYTRAKMVTSRWPSFADPPSASRGTMHFPTAA